MRVAIRVLIVCPAPRGSRLGNRITAVRWARVLRELGCFVRIAGGLVGTFDVLIALHARKSGDMIAKCRVLHPATRIVVAMTGTDLYRDLPTSRVVRRSLEIADEVVVLHPGAISALPAFARKKAFVIVQSAMAEAEPSPRRSHGLQVAVVGHLRDEKDPLRAAMAVRALPATSSIRVVHAGAALSDRWARAARSEMRKNPRYRWLGELGPAGSRRLIARSDVLVLSSRMEGGANVLGEAVVAGTPILASRIPATESLLGPNHPGLFDIGDTTALTALFVRCEEDPGFMRTLRKASRSHRSVFAPLRERTAWRRLLGGGSRECRAHLPG